MENTARAFCLRAVAYLKVQSPAGEETCIELSHDDSPVLRNIGNGLLAAYLVDEGDSFSYVQYRHLHEAQLSEEQLHAHAVSNLAALAEKQVEVRQYGSIYAVLMGGHFEASLILLDNFWSEWYPQLAPSGFVAVFPARDILAFGDISLPAAASELRAVCDRTAGQVDHPLASSLFRRVGASWEPIHG